MVVSTDLGWLHLAFETLTGIFFWVGVHMNVCKTVGMVCRPFRASRVWADEAYISLMTGEGRIFKEWQRQRQRVLCLECRK